jgi:hypothetical protein
VIRTQSLPRIPCADRYILTEYEIDKPLACDASDIREKF